MKKRNDCLFAYFGHHKCASQWIRAIISDVCCLLGLKLVNVSGPGRFNRDLKQFVSEKEMDFLTYTNANDTYVRELENYRGFHVIRDPRDIVVSAYFSHRNSHSTDKWPELIEHRKKLQEVSLEDGLYIEMDKRQKQFDVMARWDYSRSNILELRMEDLIIDPERLFREVFGFLSLFGENGGDQPGEKAVSAPELSAIIDNHRFAKKSGGRKPGQENAANHYRKGIAGDWKNYFTPKHIDYFKNKYNGLLVSLGYEQNRDWTI